MPGEACREASVQWLWDKALGRAFKRCVMTPKLREEHVRWGPLEHSSQGPGRTFQSHSLALAQQVPMNPQGTRGVTCSPGPAWMSGHCLSPIIDAQRPLTRQTSAVQSPPPACVPVPQRSSAQQQAEADTSACSGKLHDLGQALCRTLASRAEAAYAGACSTEHRLATAGPAGEDHACLSRTCSQGLCAGTPASRLQLCRPWAKRGLWTWPGHPKPSLRLRMTALCSSSAWCLTRELGAL